MNITVSANNEPLNQNKKRMRYRPLGKTGLEVSALSMGCMRLSDDMGANQQLVSRAIDLGVNYFETTRFYCGGQCQQRTAPGLKERTRGIIVSGKAGIKPDTTAYQFQREIDRQLEILGLTHFKFFQVGWFGWDRIGHLLKRGGVLDALRAAQDTGLVQHIGFTGHDWPENFIKCIETGLFDSITVPYSMINRMYESTIRRAGELGVGVVAMCPLAGGLLASESDTLREVLKTDSPMAELALRFVLANPHVSTACSGMTTLEILEENVRAAAAFDPVDDVENERMCGALDRLTDRIEGDACTTCGYCTPCPEGVDIPRYMDAYNRWKMFGYEKWTVEHLRGVPSEKSLDRCVECGECEQRCPNAIPIVSRLTETARLLGA